MHITVRKLWEDDTVGKLWEEYSAAGEGGKTLRFKVKKEKGL